MDESQTVTIVGIILGVVGTALAAYFLRRPERKDSVDKIASDKKVSEIATASLLEARTEKIAEAVKKEMLERIGNLFNALRSEITLKNQQIDSEMKARDIRISTNRKDSEELHQQTKRDLERFIENTFIEFKNNVMEILKKQAREIQRVQSITFGPEAHSFPGYVFDIDKTASDDLKDPVGLFKIQSDENQEQQTEDNEERLRIEQEKKNTEEDEDEEYKRELHKESTDVSKESENNNNG